MLALCAAPALATSTHPVDTGQTAGVDIAVAKEAALKKAPQQALNGKATVAKKGLQAEQPIVTHQAHGAITAHEYGVDMATIHGALAHLAQPPQIAAFTSAHEGATLGSNMVKTIPNRSEVAASASGISPDTIDSAASATDTVITVAIELEATVRRTLLL